MANEDTKEKTTVCGWCGTQFVQPGFGRPKKYCSANCTIQARRKGAKEKYEQDKGKKKPKRVRCRGCGNRFTPAHGNMRYCGNCTPN